MKQAGINVMPPTIHPERDMRAKEEFSVMVAKKDWRMGIRNDPQRCAAALSERRTVDLDYSDDDGVWIGKCHARVTVPDQKSPTGYTCLRCKHDANTQLKKFDNDEHIDNLFPVMVRFQPVSRHDRPDVKRERDAKRKDRAHGPSNGARRNSARISYIRGKILR